MSGAAWLAALLVVLGVSIVPRSAAAQYAVGVPYDGELIDGSNMPVSGVFPLRFVLYPDAESTEPLWTEETWVAVAGGMYHVTLGRVTAIPATLDGQELSLAVQTRDGSTITRHNLRVFYERIDGGGASATIRYTAFADLAALALNADRASHAENCARLSGRTLAQFDQSDDIERRVNDLEQALTSTASRLGSETITLPAFGGDGNGNPYEVMCPPGFAMTGARGGNGNLVDSVQPICTRLE